MKINEIKINPNNPRLIKDGKFKKLVKSIESFPKMMELRPIIIDENNIILGGNMRYTALKQLGYKEIPDNWIKQADKLTDEEKKEFIVKDNVGFGDWDYDLLANQWDEIKLEEWGMDLNFMENENNIQKENKDKKKCHFSFSICNNLLTTGVGGGHMKYYALYRNKDMDLELLKSEKYNILLFVSPLIQYFKSNNIKNIIIAPKGTRAKKNGFHFVTELMAECKKYITLNIIDIFENKNNKIYLKKNIDIPKDCIIFDDILTRGTTLKKMCDLTNVYNNLILLTNH
jgi:hypothetical protein